MAQETTAGLEVIGQDDRAAHRPDCYCQRWR